MNQDCQKTSEQLALLLYGELSFDQEEQVESHLDGCLECRVAMERQKAVHAALDAGEVTPSPALLARCREDLSELLGHEDASRAAWWKQWVPDFRIPNRPWLRPVGALTLVALGFFAAKVTPMLNLGDSGQFQAASLASFGGAQVRDIERQPDGQLRIVLDETHQRTVSGNLTDQAVRALLLAAAKDAPDPGLRAQTVAILIGGADAADVRQALVFSLANDQNTGVRVKAMEGLQRYAADPEVQDALAQVLLSDQNAGLRTQAIDLLMSPQGEILNRRVVGALQELMGREDDSYVRQRCRKALESARASAEIY